MTEELVKPVDDVPVLTEVVSEEPAARRALDPIALEALARELERAVLERLGPEIDRALEVARAELRTSVSEIVREAVAASVAQALATPKPE
jgi:hypothetical protein